MNASTKLDWQIKKKIYILLYLLQLLNQVIWKVPEALVWHSGFVQVTSGELGKLQCMAQGSTRTGQIFISQHKPHSS